MRLVALFSLFIPGAFAQAVDVPLPARTIFTVSLTSDTPQVSKPFSIDPAANVDISLMSTSPSLTVTLVDPAGNSHAAGSTDSIVTDSVTGNLAASGTLMDFEFTLTNPPPGMWHLALQDTIAPGNYVPALFQMTSDSALVAGLVGTGLDFPTAAPFSFAFVLLDTQSGLPPESVTVNASIRLNDQPATTLNFHDDGLGHDQKANDGIFTATTQVSTPGDYSVSVTAQGTWKGQPFTRTAAGVIHVATPCINLNGTFQSAFQKASGLVLSFDTNAGAAANVLLTAELTAANGKQVSSSSFTDVQAGTNSLSVSFPMEWLSSLQANGPYSVSTVTAGCVDPQTLHAATSDQATNLGLTVAVNMGVTGSGLSVSSAQLDFGPVNVGATRDLKLTVSNMAAVDLAINSLAATGAFLIQAPSTPVVVPAGQSVDITVRFSPSSAETTSGTLSIISTDPVNPVLTVVLKGTGSGGTGGGGGSSGSTGTCLAPPANIVSWWAGDGNANDSVGANNGTLQGGASYGAGEVGQAFQLDGNTGYVSIGNPANLRLANALTVEAWINPHSGPPASGAAGTNMAAVLTKWGQNSNPTPDSDSYGLWLRANGSALTMFSAIHQSGTSEPNVQGGSIPLDTWSHVAMSFDSASGQFVLYVNGQVVASVNSPGAITATSRNVLIGHEDSSLPRPFNGIIDEVSIYSRALTASEIQAIFNAGSAGKCKPAGGTSTPPKDVLLQVDGGTFNGAVGYFNGVNTAVFVNRLTPPSYPATLKTIQIYFGNRANGLAANSPISLVLGLNGSGSATFSAQSLDALYGADAIVVATGIFNSYTVSPPITITSGDFIIGFATQNPPNVYPADEDQASPSQKRSYISSDGATFSIIDSLSPQVAGNFGIRATATVGAAQSSSSTEAPTVHLEKRAGSFK